MALPATGTIALSQVNTELGFASTTNISLNQTSVRTLFGKASGAISMSDGYGKAIITYTTLDPANLGAGITLSNGNLTATIATATGGLARSILYVSSGKRYYEFTSTGIYPVVGVVTSNAALSNTYPGADSQGWGYYTNSYLYHNGQLGAFGSSWTTGDIIGVELDLDVGTLGYYKNGVYLGIAFTGLAGWYLYAAVGDYSVTGALGTFNFGATAWNHAPRAGYVGWYS